MVLLLGEKVIHIRLFELAVSRRFRLSISFNEGQYSLSCLLHLEERVDVKERACYCRNVTPDGSGYPGEGNVKSLCRSSSVQRGRSRIAGKCWRTVYFFVYY